MRLYTAIIYNKINEICNVDTLQNILVWIKDTMNINSIHVLHMRLTSIQKVSVGPSISLTLEIVDTAAPRAVSYRLHLNNISYSISFSIHISFEHNNVFQ